MNFIPHPDKILIEPIERKTVIDTGEKMFLESGKVIAVGININFVKKGDIIHFIDVGCTEIRYENKSYYVVSSDNGVILGKHEK